MNSLKEGIIMDLLMKQLEDANKEYNIDFNIRKGMVQLLINVLSKDETIHYYARLSHLIKYKILVLTNKNIYVISNHSIDAILSLQDDLQINCIEYVNKMIGNISFCSSDKPTKRYTVIKSILDEVKQVISKTKPNVTIKTKLIEKERQYPTYFIYVGISLFITSIFIYLLKGSAYQNNVLQARYIESLYWAFFVGIIGFGLTVLGITKKDI